MRSITLTAVCVLALSLASCASTRLTSTWTDERYTEGPFEHVLVVGVSDRPGQRREFEDKFVRQLGSYGVRATSSATMLPTEDELTKQGIQSAIAGTDIDGVIVTHLLGVEEQQVYNPPTAHVVPSYHGFYGYYHSVYDYVHTPGYYSTHVTVRLETNLYEAKTAALMWSGQSETLDPNSASKVVDGVIGVVIGDMRKAALL